MTAEGGFLSRTTAQRLGDVLRSLKARVGALEGKSGTSGFSTQRDDLYIAIPQAEIAAATVTPTLITPASGLCDLFHWNGTALAKRGSQKVYNFLADPIPADEPIAVHREWSGGKFFALRPATGTGGGGGVEFDCGAVFDPDDDLEICTGLTLAGKVQLFLDRDSLLEAPGEFALVYTPSVGWSLMPIVGCD